MSEFRYRRALIVGIAPGISASVARLGELGVKVAAAARDIGKLKSLVDEIGAAPFAVDASAVASLFKQVEEKQGAANLVVFNASSRAQGPLAELDPATVEKAIAISAFGGLLVTQQPPLLSTQGRLDHAV